MRASRDSPLRAEAIGIDLRHILADGTVTTQPEFSYHFDDVNWRVENYGTDPDIEIECRPAQRLAGRADFDHGEISWRG